MADSRVSIDEHIVNPTLHPGVAENSLSIACHDILE